jgi:hypothetical protein
VCQRLYVASRTELARVRKTKTAPYLELHAVGPKRASVREHFPISDFPYLYVAEAQSPCGCGFPEELPKRKLRPLSPEEAATMKRLKESLQPAARGRPRVQLLLCFMGEEESQMTPGRTVILSELDSPEFRFRNLEIVTVLRAP